MSLRACLAACLVAVFAHAGAAVAQDHPEGMHVHDAYARISGVASGAIFFMVHNHTTIDDRLIGASTAVAERAQLHVNLEDANGVMSMVEVKGGLAIAAGEMLELARGGDHIMLMGVTGPLSDGDMIPLTLTFEQAGEMTLQVPVDNARKPGGMDHGAMDHGAMDHGAMDHGAAKE